MPLNYTLMILKKMNKLKVKISHKGIRNNSVQLCFHIQLRMISTGPSGWFCYFQVFCFRLLLLHAFIFLSLHINANYSRVYADPIHKSGKIKTEKLMQERSRYRDFFVF